MKLPFYKCLIVQAFDNYQLVELERVEYFDEKEIRERETYW